MHTHKKQFYRLLKYMFFCLFLSLFCFASNDVVVVSLECMVIGLYNYVGAISSSGLITTTCMVNVGAISSSKRHLWRVSDQKK